MRNNNIVHETAQAIRKEMKTVIQSAYLAAVRLESANDVAVGFVAAELAADCSLFSERYLRLMDDAIEQGQARAKALKGDVPNDQS